MVDAESALFKARSAYFSRCQTGVKLREELAAAQSSLTESQTALVASYPGPPSQQPPTTPSSASAGPSGGGGFASGSPLPAPHSNGGGSSNSTQLAAAVAGTPADADTCTTTTADPGLMNLVVKQKAKVDRLEKQLADNDKKVGALRLGCIVLTQQVD